MDFQLRESETSNQHLARELQDAHLSIEGMRTQLAEMRPKAGEAREVAVQAHRQDPEVARAIEEVAGYHALLG